MNAIAQMKSCIAEKNSSQCAPRLCVSDRRILGKATGSSAESGSSLVIVLSILSVLVVLVVTQLVI